MVNGKWKSLSTTPSRLTLLARPTRLPFTIYYRPLTNLYLDSALLLLAALGQVQKQDAVLVVGRYRTALDRVGQTEGAHEAPLRPFGPSRASALGERASAAYDEAAVVEVDFERVAVDTRKV